jgi:uncharacterized membrane protein YjdF
MHIFFSIAAVLSAVLTAVLYWFGLDKFYFWYYPWFDIPLHIVGGLTIGFWGASLAWRRRYSPYQAFFFILLLAIAIGSIWELFEYTSGLTGGEPGYWFDTLKDMSDDSIGAVVAWTCYRLLYTKKDKTL